MPRSLTGGMLTGIAASLLRPGIFVDMEFITTTAHVWSGIGNQSFNSHTYSGIGSLGGISVVEEVGTVEAKGVKLILSGLESSLVADAIQEFKPGGAVSIYLGLFDSGGALIANPVLVWAGRMDQPDIEVGGDTAVITVSAESRIIDNRVPNQLRYTQDVQQALHPGDVSFQWVTSIQQQNISWGAHPTSSPV